MAVGVRLKMEGGTQEQYEAIHAAMDIDADPPSGLIIHTAGPVDGGWGVIDFWESEDAFNSFSEQRLRPKMQELGDRGSSGAPDIKFFPVHHITKGNS